MASGGNGENGMGLVEIGKGLFYARHGEQVMGPSGPDGPVTWHPGPGGCAGLVDTGAQRSLQRGPGGPE